MCGFQVLTPETDIEEGLFYVFASSRGHALELGLVRNVDKANRSFSFAKVGEGRKESFDSSNLGLFIRERDGKPEFLVTQGFLDTFNAIKKVKESLLTKPVSV